jgi:hypothetical protein
MDNPELYVIGAVRSTKHVYQYGVSGLPRGHWASMAQETSDGPWSIFYAKGPKDGDWTGEYKSTDEALAAIKRII